MTTLDLAGIPEELRDARAWCVWRAEERGGKQTKVPYGANGGPFKSNDPATWATFEEAVAAFERGDYSGLGRAVSAPYTGVDLDWKHATCDTPDWLGRVLSLLDSWTEWSPSGRGAHVWIKGEWNGGARQFTFPDGSAVEVYDSTSPRYFTMTGNTMLTSPAEIRGGEEAQGSLDALAAELAKATAKPATKSNGRVHGDELTGAPEGSRRAALTSEAGRLRVLGVSRGEARAVLEAVAAKCTPPVPADHVEEILSWAWRKPAGEPRSCPVCAAPEPCAEHPATPPPPVVKPAAESMRAFMARVRQMPEPSWFVKDLVPDEGVCIWHGRPRSMKSLTAEDVMLSLALGEPHALNNPRFAIAGPVPLLWLGEEDPERLDAFRFSLMLKARGIPESQSPETFRLVVRPGWDLETPHGQAELLALIQATSASMSTPLRVLVIDPARASLPSIDGGPKDAARARAFLLTILRETTIRVILLPHHDVKPARDGKDERSRAERAGGGVTFSMGDCMVNFERLGDRECLAVPTAYKVGNTPPPFKVVFTSETTAGEGFRGFLRASAVGAEEADGARGKILAFIRANPWSSTGEVDRGANLRTGEAARFLAQLEEAGMLLRATGDDAKARGRSSNATLWGCP